MFPNLGNSRMNTDIYRYIIITTFRLLHHGNYRSRAYHDNYP